MGGDFSLIACLTVKKGEYVTGKYLYPPEKKTRLDKISILKPTNFQFFSAHPLSSAEM